jgi:Tfp pilus assembly protein FimT
MGFMERREGLSLIELLVVMSFISILVLMAGVLSARFAARHSTDDVTRTISSTLQLIKLKASRQGVEYQAVLTFTSSKNTLTVVTQRGNSNRGTCSTCYVTETSQIINVQGIALSPASQTYNFNPDGTLGAASGTIKIMPSDGVGGKRCGKVIVSPFGRIRIIEGSWDPSANDCNPAY